jgi:type I restriction enzyme S subunit
MMAWPTRKLGELTDISRGSSPRPICDTKYIENGTIPWVKIADATKSGKFLYHTKEHVNDYGASFSRRLPPGTILVAASGTLGYTQILGVEGCAHDGWLILQNLRALDRDFAYYALKTVERHFFNSGSGAAIQNINTDILRQTEIPYPPLSVQRRIAGILSAYDDLIENDQRRIKILEKMARSLYREWFVLFRFPGHDKVKMVSSPLGPIPQGWEVNAIQQFGEVITGKTPSKANLDFYGQDVPFVKTPDMHGNMFILETGDSLSMAGAESQANKTIPAGSICVSCIGTIGVVSLTTEDCQTNQQINSVILARGETREFLFIQLQDLKQKLENLGSTGATMGNVNKGKFESMEILAPPDDLLERYHRLVEPTFSETLNLSRRIQNLRRTRNLLLPRLLSGHIEIQNADSQADKAQN